MLKKIEELTLHVIEQNKKIEVLDANAIIEKEKVISISETAGDITIIACL